MIDDWFFLYVPRTICALTFLVNPVFVYLIFTEKSANFGNYRFLLLYFAIFNLIYSVVNVVVPLDIHSYRYCFFLTVRHGWFFEASEINFHMMTGRCSLVAASYAVLLIHFIYRYLVIHNSSLTRNNFHWYLTISAFVFVLYFATWHAICYFPGRANVEIREYIRKDFFEIYGTDSMDFNMLGALFNEGSAETTFTSWLAVMMWSAVSVASIISFLIMARMIMYKLNKMTVNASKRTSKFQLELLRALIVQTVIPIFISFSPCLLCWYSPMFGIQLARGFNYFEVSALGVFACVDPVAIILCLPIFRKRIFNFWRGVPSLAVGAKESTDQRNS
ncbi:Serpentine Receptor, class J [Caenorhabditis elegans]|uniref:Serpentine Receptor, class J n=1 Tax=Caenorhabditis elegans TaxID=6239 RepID=O16990_CAEEL|nr:Serpentine Receptor, class J [Caenorhabditis elegans]CCD71819.1 Serpentine Receptor, class J [Caenorhabditis elegans]|eukprot:NP_503772.1 Serpentine Receptor, class J [Caenorhabditis elegans]